MLRELKTSINLRSQSTTYMSFLVRRPGTGAGGAEIHLTDDTVTRCKFGWDSSFSSYAGLERTTRGPIVQADTTYFVVAKIVAKDPHADEMFLQVYAPSETIDATEPTTWTITPSPQQRLEELTALWIKPTSTAVATAATSATG